MIAIRFWPRTLTACLIPLLLLVQIPFWSLVVAKVGLQGTADFRQLYAGGYMVRTGHGHELYDLDAQNHFEEILVPEGGTHNLPINHLGLEELLVFAPLSFLPYRTAYILFLGINVGLLALSLAFLWHRTSSLSKAWRWFPLFLFATFGPIWATLAQGQDSILVLALLSCALWLLDQGRDLAAGLAIGAAAFKFPVVIPLGLLFMLWKRWRVCQGILITGSATALISLALVGIHGVREYLNILGQMSLHLSRSADTAVATKTSVLDHLNLRGALSGVLQDRLPHTTLQIIIGLASIGVLLAARKCRPSLPLAILAASLVSYHFLGHDASVLLIPVALALCSNIDGQAIAATVVLVACSVGLLAGTCYLAGLTVLAFFLGWTVGELSASWPAGSEQHRG